MRNRSSKVLIDIENLTHEYECFCALKDLSLTLDGGKILGLLGPNGAGKTTTLKILAGILVPTSGTVTLGGFDIVKESIEARRVTGFVPDTPSALDHLTVWEHILMYAALYKLSFFEVHAEQLLVKFELADKKNVIAKDLSLGMRQKMSICCNYLISPKVMLFDEPLTGLDPQGIQTLKESIKDLATLGVAIVLSSHLLSILEDLCTDVLILDKGEKLYSGSIDDLMLLVEEHSTSANLEDAFFQITQG